MREIKFRAWDKVEKQIIESNEIEKIVFSKMAFGNYLIKIETVDFKYKSQECILMQFTGLKDKNGKEIYEGDIVRCNAIGINFGTTVIKNDFFAEHIVELKKELQKDLEVIGNIYENLELLGEKE